MLDGRFYFHSALDGRKIDNIQFYREVSFTVVGNIEPVYAKNFTTYCESVMVFGTIAEVADLDEKFLSLYALAENTCRIIWIKLKTTSVARSQGLRCTGWISSQ